MDFSFLTRKADFQAWSLSHMVIIIGFLVFSYVIIMLACKYLKPVQQKRLLFTLSLIPFIGEVSVSIIKICCSTFSLQEDLPIHICRILALIVPWIYWKEKKLWTGIAYFWILVGTVNAVLTPDLYLDFPHWEYFRYFVIHLGLIMLPLYYIFVMGHRIVWKDFIYAVIASNLFILSSLAINLLLGSNYMFTMHKPEAKTLLDVMGPWPWYLFTVELLGMVLFFLAYLPFRFMGSKN